LGDNGAQIIEKLGLLPVLQKAGSHITKTQLRNKRNVLIKNLPIGKGGYYLHRADLLRLLLKKVNQNNIKLIKKCTYIRQNKFVRCYVKMAAAMNLTY
jgi:2-polyprenyl-6-methoxyphenol hydroxylase-like FAD-dependent oxidoreductase